MSDTDTKDLTYRSCFFNFSSNSLASSALTESGASRISSNLLICEIEECLMKTVAIGILGAGLFVIAIVASQSLSSSQTGKILEKWETTNNSFRIRVTSYAEKNGSFAPGAHYVFESSPVLTDEWREIVVVQHDDPVPIPRNQVRFVNERIGYIFMGWTFAVTTNGGSNWSVWRANKDLPDWECCNYKLIEDTAIAPNGSGTMTLSPIPGRKGEVPRLQTRDYGRHWLLP